MYEYKTFGLNFTLPRIANVEISLPNNLRRVSPNLNKWPPEGLEGIKNVANKITTYIITVQLFTR